MFSENAMATAEYHRPTDTFRLADTFRPTDTFRPRGFLTNDGYVGFLPDGRRLSFPTYDEYLEFVMEEDAA